MATITLSDMREKVRQRADMENSGLIQNPELDGYINNSYKELYDIIVSRFEDYYFKIFLFTISGSDVSVDLPDDFYKLRGVDLLVGGPDNYITISKWNFQERGKANRILNRGLYGWLRAQYRIMGNTLQFLPAEIAAGQYRMWYIPLCTSMVVGNLASLYVQDIFYQATDLYTDGNVFSVTYTGGAVAGFEVVTVVGNALTVQIEDNVSTAQQVFDALTLANFTLFSFTISGTAATPQVVAPQAFLSGGIIQVDGDDFNGWQEYLIVDAAIKCLVKEESDVSVLMMEKQQLIARIDAMANNRDAGEPERITDIKRYYDDFWWINEN